MRCPTTILCVWTTVSWAATPASAGTPRADRPVLLCDKTMIASIEGPAVLRPEPLRRGIESGLPVSRGTLPTVLRPDAKTWLHYAYLPLKTVPGASGRESVALSVSADGLTWTFAGEGVLKLPAEVVGSFTPLLDQRPDAPAARRFKALARSKDGELLALASADGKAWAVIAPAAKPALDAEAFYGRNGAFWYAPEQCYVAFVSQQHGGRRVICRMTSKDFVAWSRPEPLKLNLDGEDLWSAAVFSVVSSPPLLVGLLTRTPAGAVAPADVCLATSRDGGRTFERRSPEAWVRPPDAGTTWQAMAASSFFPIRRQRAIGPVGEWAFHVGGRRYELFANRFVGVEAAPLTPVDPDTGRGGSQPAVIVTRPFVVTGNALEFNASTDSTGGFRCEILDQSGQVIPGYARTDCIRARGISGGYIWVQPDNMAEGMRAFKRPIAGDLFGDGAAMRPGWRYKKQRPPHNDTMQQLWPDWDIGELKGRTVRLRILAHGTDLFSFVTADREPVAGEVIPIPTQE